MSTFAAEPWLVGDALRGYRWSACDAHASLLLQHGYAEYAERYVERHNRLIPALVAAGFDVYAFDMRGHGRSTGARGAVDVECAVQNHLAARQTLRETGRPLFLLGHSLGGLVTAASVARHQDQVAGVILSAPALLLNVNPILKAVANGLVRVMPTLGVLPPQPATGLSRDPDAVEVFRRDPLIYHGRMPVRTGATAMAVARGNWPRYRDWRVPTLTLHGSADSYADPKGSALFHALIKSSTKRLIEFDGGKHELLNDCGRNETLTTILEWLFTVTSANQRRVWA